MCSLPSWTRQHSLSGGLWQLPWGSAERRKQQPDVASFSRIPIPQELPEKVPQVSGRWHCMAALSGTGKSFLWNVCVCQTTKEKLAREGKKGSSGWWAGPVWRREPEPMGATTAPGGWKVLWAPLVHPTPWRWPLALDGAELVTLGEAEWVELKLEVDGLGWKTWELLSNTA